VSDSPRIYGIAASQAPIVAVIRRGPSDWCHIGRWDVANDAYEPGAWFRGTVYPQKCDLSPDGRWLVYSAMKVGSDWPAGDVYEAISRLPWLTALAAWNSGTTYTRGMHFTSSKTDVDVGDPDVGDSRPVHARYGLRWTRPVQFAVERRRGWKESVDTPGRDAGGPWDENRRVEMVKPHPAQAQTLHLDGRYAAFRAGDPDDGPPTYWLADGADIEPLDGVQWADWGGDGRLLIATVDDRLQARSTQGETVDVADLSHMPPQPVHAPDWAKQW
jgi:hypothetical protein